MREVREVWEVFGRKRSILWGGLLYAYPGRNIRYAVGQITTRTPRTPRICMKEAVCLCVYRHNAHSKAILIAYSYEGAEARQMVR